MEPTNKYKTTERKNQMKITRILNCKYTAEEMQDLGVQLAVANQRKGSLEDSKKQSQSQYKAEIDAQDATIKSLSQKLARGSEDRNVDCEVLFHTPSEGKKTIARSDTGATVDVLNMTEAELSDLFINNLGAQKDTGEFVFRDKSRVKMCSFEDFKKIRDKGEFEKIGDGYDERELVDAKPENTEFVVVVYEIDDDKQDQFEVYRFKQATAAPAAATEPAAEAPKQITGGEVIDAETVNDTDDGTEGETEADK